MPAIVKVKVKPRVTAKAKTTPFVENVKQIFAEKSTNSPVVITGIKENASAQLPNAFLSTSVDIAEAITGQLLVPEKVIEPLLTEILPGAVCPDLYVRCSLKKIFLRWHFEFFNVDEDFEIC